MKETYVKPTIKSEVLEAEVLCNCGSPGTPVCGRRGFFFWKNLD